ncbi:hypothetical protein J6590_079107 [Homalodisca vitripennis]|nr:hypothetical protein J6590_079107 [Homalodisca vitripennis]
MGGLLIRAPSRYRLTCFAVFSVPFRKVINVLCLTGEQGKKATHKNWKCEVCASETSSSSSRKGEGGQSTVLQAIAVFRAEVSDFRKESSEKCDQSWEKLIQLQSDLKKVTTEISNLNSKLHVVENRCDDACGDILALKGENRSLKAMWMSAARERKGILASAIHSSFPPDSKVLINEHLTTQPRQPFNGARELVRQGLLSVAWTNDGMVLAKSTPGGATFRIQHQDQLDQMKRRFMELTIPEAGGQAITRIDTVPAAAT